MSNATLSDKTTLIEPFSVDFDLAAGVMKNPTNHLMRRASDMRGYYHDAALKCGDWERGDPGVELEGKTPGLVGCGRVGKLVARMALGCGMEVVAFEAFRT